MSSVYIISSRLFSFSSHKQFLSVSLTHLVCTLLAAPCSFPKWSHCDQNKKTTPLQYVSLTLCSHNFVHGFVIWDIFQRITKLPVFEPTTIHPSFYHNSLVPQTRKVEIKCSKPVCCCWVNVPALNAKCSSSLLGLPSYMNLNVFLTSIQCTIHVAKSYKHDLYGFFCSTTHY